MRLYKIKNWAETFENNRSKAISKLTWVAIPNSHDGENYSAIITHQDGAIIFAAWVLIVQVSSKCRQRGVLMRDDGRPHTPESLSLKTRAPNAWFEIALEFIASNTDWIEFEDVADERQVNVSSLPPTDAGVTKEGREGIGEKGSNTSPKKPFVYPTDFEQWWSHYPKKCGKGGALAVWNGLKKTNRLPALDVLVRATDSHSQSLDWTKDGGQFIPDPERWLKKHRWEDGVGNSATPTPQIGGFSVLDMSAGEQCWQSAQRLENLAKQCSGSDWSKTLSKAASYYTIKDAGGNPNKRDYFPTEYFQ
jgi:hypothetical protein